MTPWSELHKEASLAKSIALRRPFNVLAQVTNRCNLTCSFCDFWPHGAPKDELTLDEYAGLSEQLAGIGSFVVSIEGGEPMVRADLVPIVQTFARWHFPVVYTNGWFIDDASADALIAAGVSQVGVSIDYPDAVRHDAKRGRAGTWDRAWAAVERLRARAPRGSRQIHVMTVLMEDNLADLDDLLAMSAQRDVGHMVTLLSTRGYRRTATDSALKGPVSDAMLARWKRWPHLRVLRDYLAGFDAFLEGRDVPACRAGAQSFNLDHVGGVAPCIEKIDAPAGNVREKPLVELIAALRDRPDVAACNDCWTLCRGLAQGLGNGSNARSLIDLGTRLRSR